MTGHTPDRRAARSAVPDARLRGSDPEIAGGTEPEPARQRGTLETIAAPVQPRSGAQADTAVTGALRSRTTRLRGWTRPTAATSPASTP